MLAACDADDDRTIVPTLVMGTDCPALTSAHLRQAAACLAAGDDAILVPAEDGGYVLIGLRQAHAGVFTDIDWGSGKVLQQTRRKLARLGWHWREPVRLWDVDRPEDLPRLRQLAP